MNLQIDVKIDERYTSASQRTRLFTEKWAYNNVLCPSCGGALEKYPNNRPVADFECRTCFEDFELKATSGRIGKSIPDGAYTTMMKRLSSKDNPNLFLLQYDFKDWFVCNLLVIPRYYFSPSIIQKRTPLSPTARRAGWMGCNILVGDIPKAGRIPLVVDRIALPQDGILTAWNKTRFLKEVSNEKSKNWLLKTMSCIDQLGKRQFELRDVYGFESQLRETFPGNQHIREKLRQQLQILRDKGYLRFLGEGHYELISTVEV
jgi:type II restriction enzyme